MQKKYFDKSFEYDIESFLVKQEKDKKHTVLAVDDEENNLALLRRTLRGHYNVLTASGPNEALKILEEHSDEISLIVSDQKMPEMEGTDFLKIVANKYPEIVSILLTGHSNIDILVDAINSCHLFQYILKPYEPEELCLTIENGIEKFELESSRAQVVKDLSELFYKTLKAISIALDAKDPYTHGHSLRVTIYSLALAKELGLDDKILEEIETAGLLHDIGKISIPERIIAKPGRLTDEEFAIIKKHPELGVKLIANIKKLDEVSNWMKAHHERYDGTGYPSGLKGEEIPLSARIIAIADTYDAMTSSRSYRNALAHEVAIGEIERCAGSQFDPELAKLFVGISDKINAIKEDPDTAYKKYSHLYKLMNVSDEDFSSVL